MPPSKFLLRCLPSRNSDISLPDGVDVIIGRNRLTKLKDFRLSRKHASLTADENTERIEFIQLGANSSFITKKSSVEGRKAVRKGQSIFLRPGDTFELLGDLHKFQIVSRPISRPLTTMSSNSQNSSFFNTSGSGPGEPLKNHWSQALYATMQDPSMVEYEDEQICIIKDRYPKARFHVLVLPKEKLLDLSYMTGDHVTLVEQMVKRGKALAKEKNVLSYKMGFHCVPSMAQVHMHIISDDFDSPCLKNKKHWNSFNTKYFISPEEVLCHLSQDGKVPFDEWRSQSKALLSTELKCHKCDYKPKNLPDLKKHLLSH